MVNIFDNHVSRQFNPEDNNFGFKYILDCCGTPCIGWWFEPTQTIRM